MDGNPLSHIIYDAGMLESTSTSIRLAEGNRQPPAGLGNAGGCIRLYLSARTVADKICWPGALGLFFTDLPREGLTARKAHNLKLYWDTTPSAQTAAAVATAVPVYRQSVFEFQLCECERNGLIKRGGAGRTGDPSKRCERNEHR
jgi:hypothetical protein